MYNVNERRHLRKGDAVLIRTPADLGAVIRDRRRRMKMGQQALADKVGVSRQWVVEVEKGKPRAEVALILRTLDTLGVTLSSAEAQPSTSSDIDQIVESARRRG
jgi:HTH-type transcriptional regulator/antitoxin HipB